MNMLKLYLKKSIYVTLPLLYCVILHLLFTYGAWDINPRNWQEMTRIVETLLFIFAMVIGSAFADSIYKKQI